MTIFLSSLNSFTSLFFTSQLLLSDDALLEACLEDGLVDLRHELVSKLLLQGLLEIFVRVHLNSKVRLHSADRFDALDARLVQVGRDLAHLADLNLKALVLGLLPFVGFVNHVVQDGDLLLKVALNVVALRLGDVLNCILLTLELLYFFACEGYLLLQLNDLLLELINGSLEAEWLVRAQRSVGLACYGCTNAG